MTNHQSIPTRCQNNGFNKIYGFNYFVKIDGKGIALVKQQVCRDGAVMYIVQVCGCDFDVEIDAKRVQTVTAGGE